MLKIYWQTVMENLYLPILHLPKVEQHCKLQEKSHRVTGPLVTGLKEVLIIFYNSTRTHMILNSNRLFLHVITIKNASFFDPSPKDEWHDFLNDQIQLKRHNNNICTLFHPAHGVYIITQCMVVTISPFIPRDETSVSFIPHSLRKTI